MKKFLGGCLIVFLLLAVVGGGAAWWFVLRPAWHAGSELIGTATQLADLAQLDKKVKNQSAFSPPADGRIPDQALERFIAVQQTLDQRVGEKLAALEARYAQIEASAKAKGGSAGATELLGAYGDLLAVVREAKLSQVDAMNAQGFSVEEYRWVRNQAFMALARSTTSSGEADGTSAAADNARRLAPHGELLTRTAVAQALGL